ncbi:MAG TPA: hypothetical protein VHC86_03990 [Opitutaceae bacterium]|nr:hypothetical protein [Opitutaceae bacterium]
MLPLEALANASLAPGGALKLVGPIRSELESNGSQSSGKEEIKKTVKAMRTERRT